MANADRPRGLRLAKSFGIGLHSPVLRAYPAADRSADTTNDHGDIYVGDPLKIASGKVLPANSGDTVIGVAVAVGPSVDFVSFDPDNLTRRYLPHADTDGYVLVALANQNLFEVQSASDLDLVIGGTADLTTAAATAHGSQTTGQSNVEITTSVNADVEVVELIDRPDNDSTLANADYLVRFTTYAFDL